MKFSKQALLGTTVLLGGSVLLYATMHQVLNAPAKPAANSQQVIAKPTTDKQTAISNEPLTADVATEKNLLAQKQKEREQRVAAQEQQAQQYMTEQQRIEAEALARSRAENQLYANKNAANTNSVVASSVTAITQPVVKPRPVDTVAAPPQTQATVPNTVQNTAQSQSAAKTKEQAATPKPTVTAPVVAQPQPAAKTTPNNPGTYQVKAGEGLIGLSRRYNVPVDVLASINNLSTTSNLRVGQTITIPTAAQVNRITQQAQAREQQRQNEITRKKQEAEQKKQQALLQQQQEVARKKQEAAQKEQQKQQEIARKKQEAQQQAQKKQAFQAAQDNLRQARQTVKQTDVKGTFGVQVALATDQKKASEITQKLQAAGYKVKTTQTSKGVRIVVGPEKGKVAALALKDKLNNDSRVDVNSGWVLYW
ncbi:LysM peptidoglycan-binding domain-containing protein [Moraxella osloensis]|nr:LysM peptidoglycan-binding domain-containing protein [Moraxella osloensis]MBW4019086.1 LysM peptidoglycan-binding domain-containing protein [Moraxella osloensis]